MPTTREKSKRRRSRSVPLSLVPALAALVTSAACSPRAKPLDPCEPENYTKVACESAVTNRGYWYGGTWYPHVYSYAALYYLTRHNSFVSGGGRVRSISPTVYSPRVSVPSRPGVVRGGFGGIGAGHGAAGS
jgi:hypothetical protein